MLVLPLLVLVCLAQLLTDIKVSVNFWQITKSQLWLNSLFPFILVTFPCVLSSPILSLQGLILNLVNAWLGLAGLIPRKSGSGLWAASVWLLAAAGSFRDELEMGIKVYLCCWESEELAGTLWAAPAHPCRPPNLRRALRGCLTRLRLFWASVLSSDWGRVVVPEQTLGSPPAAAMKWFRSQPVRRALRCPLWCPHTSSPSRPLRAPQGPSRRSRAQHSAPCWSPRPPLTAPHLHRPRAPPQRPLPPPPPSPSRQWAAHTKRRPRGARRSRLTQNFPPREPSTAVPVLLGWAWLFPPSWGALSLHQRSLGTASCSGTFRGKQHGASPSGPSAAVRPGVVVHLAAEALCASAGLERKKTTDPEEQRGSRCHPSPCAGGAGFAGPGAAGSAAGSPWICSGTCGAWTSGRYRGCAPRLSPLRGERGQRAGSFPPLSPCAADKRNKKWRSVVKAHPPLEGLAGNLGAESQISDFLDKKFQYDSSRKWFFVVSYSSSF